MEMPMSDVPANLRGITLGPLEPHNNTLLFHFENNDGTTASFGVETLLACLWFAQDNQIVQKLPDHWQREMSNTYGQKV